MSGNAARPYHFKMQEMVKTGERQSRIPAFEKVIYDHALCEFGWGLRLSDVHAAMGRVKVPGIDLNAMAPALTAFHFIFFAMMEQFSSWIQQSPQKIIDEPVDLFFDEQSEKKVIVSNWFDYTEAHSYIRPVFGSLPRFESDHDFLPLQAADYLAWCFRQALQSDGNLSWGQPHRVQGFPGLFGPLTQDHLVGIYYRVLRQAFPDRLIFDSKSPLHPVLQEEEFRKGWQIYTVFQDQEP